MTTRTNTTLDDIAAVIGFTNAVRIAAWFGGKNLYVAAQPDDKMLVVRLIGLQAARLLAQEWGSETIAVPTMFAYEEDQRNRVIGALLNRGITPKDIARDTGITERRVRQIRRLLEELGVLPIVFGAPAESLA